MKPNRILAIDAIRGLAVIAMVVYHMSWDLAWFGHVDWNVAAGSGWKAFAALIAGTFLFVAGIALALAHGTGIRWRSFLKREAIIAAAAIAVSVATYFAFGDTFVRFGILHAIAIASLISLPFTQVPAAFGAMAAAVAVSLPLWASGPAFDGQWLLWTGLGQPAYGAVDYVPLAPWAGVMLLGVAAGKFVTRNVSAVTASNDRLTSRTGRGLRLAGRHSLAVYLLHQPLLYGLFWSLSASGLTPDRSMAIFVRDCTRSCTITFGDETVCHASCACTAQGLEDQGVWRDLIEKPQDPDLRLTLNQTYSQCLRDTPANPLSE